MREKRYIKSNGISILELLITIAVSILMVAVCLEFFLICTNHVRKVEERVEQRTNLRIAMDYLGERIKNGKVTSIGKNSFSVDSDVIYLKNGIIRVNTPSIQVVCGITGFEVTEDQGDKLFKVIVETEKESMSILVHSAVE